VRQRNVQLDGRQCAGEGGIRVLMARHLVRGVVKDGPLNVGRYRRGRLAVVVRPYAPVFDRISTVR
jgi:hypothetical protein